MREKEASSGSICRWLGSRNASGPAIPRAWPKRTRRPQYTGSWRLTTTGMPPIASECCSAPRDAGAGPRRRPCRPQRPCPAFHATVVLLDLGMPGMDGYEVAEQSGVCGLREHGPYRPHRLGPRRFPPDAVGEWICSSPGKAGRAGCSAEPAGIPSARPIGAGRLNRMEP